jgi:hypothetical protein
MMHEQNMEMEEADIPEYRPNDKYVCPILVASTFTMLGLLVVWCLISMTINPPLTCPEGVLGLCKVGYECYRAAYCWNEVNHTMNDPSVPMSIDGLTYFVFIFIILFCFGIASFITYRLLKK